MPFSSANFSKKNKNKNLRLKFMMITFVLGRWILHRGSINILFLSLLLHAQTGRAQNRSSPPGSVVEKQNFSSSMGVVFIVLIAAIFFMVFFSIYIRHCSQDSGAAGRRSQTGSVARSRRAPRGIDRAVIESFPVFDYAAVKELKIGKGALECAVCLTEFEDDDTLRLIPKCDHVFHPDCIDAWLVAHTTCPVCRADLVPHDPKLVEVGEPVQDSSIRDMFISIDNHNNEEQGRESMEQPLQGRTMSRNISFGRPRWLGRMRFTRSFSTGHVAVKQWENMERFTLRLPEEVRKQLVNGKLERTTSLLLLPRETSSRRGYRTGFNEGSSRGGRFIRSDRWTFSLAPPFFTRAPSVKSPKVVEATTAAIREGSLRGSIRAESTRLPV